MTNLSFPDDDIIIYIFLFLSNFLAENLESIIDFPTYFYILTAVVGFNIIKNKIL